MGRPKLTFKQGILKVEVDEEAVVDNAWKVKFYLAKNGLLILTNGIIYLNVEIFYRACVGALVGVMPGIKPASLVGWTSLWMLPVGGVLGWILESLNEVVWIRKHLNVFLQTLLGTGLVILTELISGLILNIALQLNVWNYSDLPLNYRGQICALFALFWFFLCPLQFFIGDFIRMLFFHEGEPYSLFGLYVDLFKFWEKPSKQAYNQSRLGNSVLPFSDPNYVQDHEKELQKEKEQKQENPAGGASSSSSSPPAAGPVHVGESGATEKDAVLEDLSPQDSPKNSSPKAASSSSPRPSSAVTGVETGLPNQVSSAVDNEEANQGNSNENDVKEEGEAAVTDVSDVQGQGDAAQVDSTAQ